MKKSSRTTEVFAACALFAGIAPRFPSEYASAFLIGLLDFAFFSSISSSCALVFVVSGTPTTFLEIESLIIEVIAVKLNAPARLALHIFESRL